ncbi:AraC family transcriptional regulator [Cellulophaga lytica]|uniref:Transcriptional regulator, AraC family n=1 Tax=Cellulophaga lytica (strain ATCC 23178 / DSM 7489 / JCM 8516 / NBRC 14961 / NCIMB 1423 / VKM B-1433 / Cy l20) TaxID=867900 RepID=F0REN3_CELLC|nr:helix-turn-helix transcriptional regulator [Cellulophaga lytica]ADY31048.1 transcriptional regulator, AraC family [Cellulophaga lytica DSM 7489]AIM62008.1 cupin [Cellulophaga lytica]WQG78041.1 helix-turn-helix transcriptional regulator [Cellulophaga lytica]
MKVLPFKIPKPDNNSLIYQEDIELVFYDKLHQHDEIQISFIEKGSGSLLVGDRISSYSENDLFVIGSNLPHAFKSDKNAVIHSKMLSLFFTASSFGDSFFELNELAEINHFLSKTLQGLEVKTHKNDIKKNFIKLKDASKFERFILFLEILKKISNAKSAPLSTFIYNKKYTDIEGKRMRNVFDFTFENAYQNITLDDVANVANMTKNAFCKYFKKRTNKTFISFLIELRIENACKLLIADKDLSINEIAFKSGFNNISNFNRQFKIIKHMTPNSFRKTNL